MIPKFLKVSFRFWRVQSSIPLEKPRHCEENVWENFPSRLINSTNNFTTTVCYSSLIPFCLYFISAMRIAPRSPGGSSTFAHVSEQRKESEKWPCRVSAFRLQITRVGEEIVSGINAKELALGTENCRNIW